jgi:hypothetical protein
MNLRDRAYFATSALVYSGPLYAGLSGAGVDIVPAFAAIFMLWLYVVRPFDWPQTVSGWLVPRAIAWPLLIFSVQMILVCFCIAVGRGMSELAGVHPPLPTILPILISMLGVSVARLLQPEGALYLFRGPGTELAIGSGILDIGVPPMPGQPADQAFVEGVLMHLADLGPQRATRDEIEAVILAVETSGMGEKVLKALANSRGDTVVQAQAQAALALRPMMARAVFGQGIIARSVNRALSTWVPQVIEETARDALALLDFMPSAVAELPNSARLTAAANSVMGDSAVEALRELAARVAAREEASAA